MRQWKRGTQAETDIRHLLVEEPQKRGKRVEDGDEDPNALAAKHLKELCKLLLSDREGDEERAGQLAAALSERYGYGF